MKDQTCYACYRHRTVICSEGEKDALPSDSYNRDAAVHGGWSVYVSLCYARSPAPLLYFHAVSYASFSHTDYSSVMSAQLVELKGFESSIRKTTLLEFVSLVRLSSKRDQKIIKRAITFER